MEGRPSVWIGHTVLTVGDVERSADYWRDLGLREVERNRDVAVLELRGGTHLLLLPGFTDADDARDPHRPQRRDDQVVLSRLDAK